MDHQDMQPIENSIKRQLEVNQAKNLLFENVEQIMDIEPGFLAALEELLDASSKDRPAGDSPKIVSFAAQALLKKVYSVNQYLNISAQKVEELEQIYRETWQAMLRSRDVRSTLREQHYPELSRWLADLYPEKFREQLESRPVIGHVVCEEYSAPLQLELLRINISHLKQPVLDIGCGSQANLVRYLRSQGIEAYGFDRQLEKQETYLSQMDWFEYPFETDRWGTLLSNMAFTNHLNYVRLHAVHQLEHYLLKMREMLEALAPGGRFYYAPSLPFVEDWFASEQYKVDRKRTIAELSVSIITRAG
jgi:SAM-dependent methyltransferase